MIYKCFIAVLAVLFLSSSIDSKSLWKDKNIYAPGSSFNVGDILIIDINDISQLKFNVTFNNDNSYNIASNPDANLTAFLPKVESNKKITSSDKADFSGRGNLNISIASRVVNKTQDGKFTITGSREYSFNGKTNRFFISGIVDPVLIKGRSVLSKDVADFRLEIRGLLEKGVVGMERPELKDGETSSGSLTEIEKQKIIVDYIGKMLREISR